MKQPNVPFRSSDKAEAAEEKVLKCAGIALQALTSSLEEVDSTVEIRTSKLVNVGPLMIRIGFWGFLMVLIV